MRGGTLYEANPARLPAIRPPGESQDVGKHDDDCGGLGDRTRLGCRDHTRQTVEIRMALVTAERLVWYCGEHTAKLEIAVMPPIPCCQKLLFSVACGKSKASAIAPTGTYTTQAARRSHLQRTCSGAKHAHGSA